MFKGDRHLHATLEEIDQWHADDIARDKLENEWRGRGVTFDQRRNEPMSMRVHRPPLPETPPVSTSSTRSGRAPAKMSGFGVVPGVAAGPLVLIGVGEHSDTTGAIIAISDPGSAQCPDLYGARGVVLLSGGLASPVAELAAELKLPVVLCPGARALSTRDVAIDGTTGLVTVR
jgi:hypothetical protein